MIHQGCEICFKENKEERLLSGKDSLIHVPKLSELACYAYSSYLGEYYGIIKLSTFSFKPMQLSM